MRESSVVEVEGGYGYKFEGEKTMGGEEDVLLIEQLGLKKQAVEHRYPTPTSTSTSSSPATAPSHTITLKPFRGPPVVIDFNPQMLVSEVKRCCGEVFRRGTDISQFVLSHGDTYLEDGYSLEHYGVEAGDTLDFIERGE